MKLKEAKEAYQECSSILSANVRNLCFAGIAIVWIFRIGSEIPDRLFLPLLFFVFSLFSDLMQYIYSSYAWGIYYFVKDKEINDDDRDVRAPVWINIPTTTFLFLKILFVLIGYVIMSSFILEKI